MPQNVTLFCPRPAEEIDQKRAHVCAYPVSGQDWVVFLQERDQAEGQQGAQQQQAGGGGQVRSGFLVNMGNCRSMRSVNK